MARTATPKEIKASKEAKAVKEVKAAPVVSDAIDAPPTTSEVKVPSLHIWEKVIGKYHTKDRKVIGMGQTLLAGKDTFVKDATWKYIGPVE